MSKVAVWSLPTSLQWKTYLTSAFDEAKTLIQLLNTKCNDEQFDCLFSRAEQIAERLEVDFKPKQRAGVMLIGKMLHRI